MRLGFWPVMIFMLIVVQTSSGLRVSSRSPLVFVVTETAGNYTHGTSIRSDGKWLEGELDARVENRIRSIYPTASVEVVNTDDEAKMHDEIQAWMDRQCSVVHKRSRRDCFVLSQTQGYTLQTSADIYDFRRWESSTRSIVKNALMPYVPLATESPTFRLTPSPTVPFGCEGRLAVDCVAPKCEYIGTMHGCRDTGWCGFNSRVACEAKRTCEFRRNRCRPRLT